MLNLVTVLLIHNKNQQITNTKCKIMTVLSRGKGDLQDPGAHAWEWVSTLYHPGDLCIEMTGVNQSQTERCSLKINAI